MMQNYDIGEVATLTAEYSNVSGFNDPVSVTFTVIDPGGTSTTYTSSSSPAVVRDSVGHYHVDLPLTLNGIYEYKSTGDGQTQSAFFMVGTSLYEGPIEPWCSWAEVASQPIFSLAGLDANAVPPSVREDIIDSTSELLWNMSDRVYPGIGSTTRSLGLRCWGCGAMWWSGGAWSGGGSGCGCGSAYRMDLSGRYPVLGVRDVYVDDVLFDSANYRLENARFLVRIDGQAWPQSSSVIDTGSFRGTWFFGRVVPTGGRRACALLCAEEALSALNKPCMLPQYRLTTVSSEGVSYSIIDQTKALEDGIIGFEPADRWLASLRRGQKVPPGGFDPYARHTIGRAM